MCQWGSWRTSPRLVVWSAIKKKFLFNGKGGRIFLPQVLRYFLLWSSAFICSRTLQLPTSISIILSYKPAKSTDFALNTFFKTIHTPQNNYYSDYYSDYRFLSNPPAFVLQYEETQEDNKFSAMVMGVWGMWWAAQGTFWTCRHCMKGGFLTDSALAKTEFFCTAWALFSEIAKLRKSSEA